MSKEVDILKQGIGYITFRYTDSSRKVIRTTLNETILEKLGLDTTNNTLYDLETLKAFPIPEDVTLSISASYPELGEVDKFANRFI
ncbi:hypothetical protein D3C73_1316280 [compost metagenome]